MQLTNTIRQAFLHAAMNDVPQIDYVQQIRDTVLAHSVDQLPPKVRAVWDDPKLRYYIRTDWNIYHGVSVTHPADGFSDLIFPTKLNQKLADLRVKADEQEVQRIELRAKLKAAAESVTTRKALAELLPEFEKYLPADESKAIKANLPAVANIVADFTKAGWPKGVKKGGRGMSKLMTNITAAYEAGQRHFKEGIARSANPYYIAAFNNGARNPEKRESVQQWWAGWDMARIQKEATCA